MLLCWLQGILAVTLVCARRLGGWQGEADPYVTLSLMDSAGGGMGLKACLLRSFHHLPRRFLGA